MGVPFCLLTLALSLSIFAPRTAWSQTASSQLTAAAGLVDITPTETAYIAGYGQNRRCIDVHDRLSARCVVLESRGVRIAIVSCDVIGIPRYIGNRIRSRIKSVPPSHVFLAATHTHSGPDTVGQWGPDIRTRGVDEKWLNDAEERVAALVDSVSARLRPADLRFATKPDVTGVSKNIRVPRILDTEMALMQAADHATGKTIATLVNFACHPEILNTRHMTADFPHWLYETVEAHYGGVCLYLNGAQGGMITADYDESTSPKGENWMAAETLGRRLGEQAIEAMAGAEPAQDPAISTAQRTFRAPLQNEMFKSLIKLHVFEGDVLTGGALVTQVSRFTIGPAEFLTIPGEALPNVGFYLKAHMSGKPKFLLGLTDDFLGYILAPEDYGLKIYDYETRVSVGPDIEPLMVQNLLDLALPPGAARAPHVGINR